MFQYEQYNTSAQYQITRIEGADRRGAEIDHIATEEPLEIRIHIPRAIGSKDDEITRTISLTMRTPGHDGELAAGFLLTEGIITQASQVARMDLLGIDWLPGESANALQVTLAPGVNVDLRRLERNFYTSSSCGVCGKASIDSVRTIAAACVGGFSTRQGLSIEPKTITALPDRLRSAQAVFEQTGGLHACALFTRSGELIALREDVGRHNALDKLIGAQLLAGRLPLDSSILLVSGRASFELVQKAVMAGIPILAAIGAPSTLAVDLAREFGMTLIGFLRGERFNLYSAPERVA